MKHLQIHSKRKDEIIDITDEIEELVQQEDFHNGVCSLMALHTTCALTTICLDPGTDLDFLEAVRQILPELHYRHQHDPSHTPDHILASIIGPSLTIPVQNGQLILGTWQRIVLVELDGPRERSLSLTFLPEQKEHNH